MTQNDTKDTHGLPAVLDIDFFTVAYGPDGTMGISPVAYLYDTGVSPYTVVEGEQGYDLTCMYVTGNGRVLPWPFSSTDYDSVFDRADVEDMTTEGGLWTAAGEYGEYREVPLEDVRPGLPAGKYRTTGLHRGIPGRRCGE